MFTVTVTVCLFCVDALGNGIGADGAAALVAALKVMTNLKELYLYSKCCMVGIVCEPSGCDELHGTGCWLVLFGVHTGTAVRGAKGNNNDVGVVREC